MGSQVSSTFVYGNFHDDAFRINLFPRMALLMVPSTLDPGVVQIYTLSMIVDYIKIRYTH